ncbi:hypothetical protein [Marinicella marina]|jgi:hypothetical protein|uniref:hypothetical protein n=1 Tax=Marinicella marina TaxID=2996016 RepID=UPI0024BD2DB1|nr:hypothetical protein [Marinicella marina]MDJ1138752.1 hypothetical protein [Marinicella marina]
MTAQDIIGKMKKTRRANIVKSKSDYKQRLHEIRKELALNSLKESPDLERYSQLITELEETKLLLKQVAAFSN